VSALQEFCLDLALRYFVSFLYNLDGFMEPLRTGLSEGAFCVLGIVCAGKCRSLGFARDDNLLEDDSFSRDDSLSREKQVPRLRVRFASRI
jgi:hypothetical protein